MWRSVPDFHFVSRPWTLRGLYEFRRFDCGVLSDGRLARPQEIAWNSSDATCITEVDVPVKFGVSGVH